MGKVVTADNKATTCDKYWFKCFLFTCFQGCCRLKLITEPTGGDASDVASQRDLHHEIILDISVIIFTYMDKDVVCINVAHSIYSHFSFEMIVPRLVDCMCR